MSETITTTPTRREIRAARFAGVKAGYEAEGPDGSVPGATSVPQRYALVTESGRGHGYFVNYCETLDDVVKASGANYSESWYPVCYYDLDELYGDPMPAEEGDIVSYEGKDYYVVHVSDDVGEGEIFHWLYLHPDSIEPASWIDVCERVDEYQCEIVKRGEGFEDPRNPKRYLLAAVRVVVVFNTEPATN